MREVSYASFAAALVAVSVLVAQPCLAAESMNNFGISETRTAAFGGVQVRLPLGQKERAKPTARLQLSSAYYIRQQSGALVQTHRSSGLELGASKAGKPAVFIGGQNAADVGKKLNVGGTTTTLLIVGGVLLVLVVIAAASTPPQIFDD